MTNSLTFESRTPNIYGTCRYSVYTMLLTARLSASLPTGWPVTPILRSSDRSCSLRRKRPMLRVIMPVEWTWWQVSLKLFGFQSCYLLISWQPQPYGHDVTLGTFPPTAVDTVGAAHSAHLSYHRVGWSLPVWVTTYSNLSSASNAHAIAGYGLVAGAYGQVIMKYIAVCVSLLVATHILFTVLEYDWF